jgi:hypothetical protein
MGVPLRRVPRPFALVRGVWSQVLLRGLQLRNGAFKSTSDYRRTGDPSALSRQKTEEDAMTADAKFKAEVLKAAREYIALGWAVFPCHSITADGQCTCKITGCRDAGKHPRTTNGLKDASLVAATIEGWFGPKAPLSNIGIVTGEVSNLTIVDIDMGEGKVGADTWRSLIAEHGEPQTLCARTGGGGLHVFFSFSSALKTGNNRLGKNIDVKNDGGYVVAPPSRHRSGGTYEWVDWDAKRVGLPSHLMPDAKEKKTRQDSGTPQVPLEDTIDMLTKVSPDNRDTWRMVGIAMGREYPDNDEAFAAYHAWSDTWGGTKGPNHDAIMKECFYVLAKQEAERQITIASIIKLAREGGWRPKAIQELNARYAVVFMGGDCKILREHTDPDSGKIDVSFASPGSVKLFHAHEPPITVGKHQMDRVDYWLAHPDRRTYQGLTFLPGADATTREGFYNLWRGFAVEPREGKCDLMLAHIEETIAAGNADHARYLFAWLANVVQRPTHRPGVAVVMRGGQGIGKGAFATHFGSLFAPHYVHLTHSRHLMGHFNALLKDALVVFADEAFWAGSKEGEGTLNALITEPTHQIELKGIDPVPVKNYLHLLVASNHDWVVPAGRDARRFFVLDVKEDHKEDFAYFEALQQQMDDGGREAFLFFLQHHDASGVNLRRAPKTAALMDQKLQSMTPVEKFWYDVLKAGSHTSDGQPVWQTKITTSDLYELYLAHAGKTGVSRRATEMELSKTLMTLVPGLKRMRLHMEWNGGQQQVRGWQFPSLAECRTAFDARMNWTTEWDDESDLADQGKEVGF